MVKGCLTFLAILLIVGAGAAGVLLVLSTQQPASSSMPAIQVSSEAVKNLDQKVDDVVKAVATAQKSGTPTPVTLRVTEQELTSKVAQALQQTPDITGLNPRDIQIHLKPDQIITTGTVSYGGFDVAMTITSQANVTNGKPKIDVQSVQIGNLPLPGGLTDQVTETIESQTETAFSALPIQLQSIRIEQGVAVITGVAKGQ